VLRCLRRKAHRAVHERLEVATGIAPALATRRSSAGSARTRFVALDARGTHFWVDEIQHNLLAPYERKLVVKKRIPLGEIGPSVGVVFPGTGVSFVHSPKSSANLGQEMYSHRRKKDVNIVLLCSSNLQGCNKNHPRPMTGIE